METNRAGGGRNRATGIVDDVEFGQGCCVWRHLRPGPQRTEETHRAVEKSDRASVGDGGVAADEGRGDALARQG